MKQWSLRTKLIYSYLAVSLLTALAIFLLARITARTRFREVVLDQLIVEIQEDVATWYAIERSWDGFLDYYIELHPVVGSVLGGRGDGDFDGPRQGEGRQTNDDRSRQSLAVGLIDADRNTLTQTFVTNQGEKFPEAFMRFAIPIEVDGEPIAYIVRSDERGIRMEAEEQIYLESTDRVLLIASAGGVALALLMGFGLANILLRPIQNLKTAAQAMADGELKQEVPVQSGDELGQLADTFNQMSYELAEATRQRRQMTADIAHDLGTPLTVISGYVEAMYDGTLKATPRRIGLISAEVEHLRRLIGDLDLLAQTDTQSLRLQMEPLDTATFLQQVAQSFEPLVAAENVQLKTEIAPQLPPVQADRERLMQVMGNLLSNAMRYTPSGGQITITSEAKDDQIIVQVRDTGEGIAADALPHIFDRFYQVDDARSERGKMGLGLAISKALVEAMSGAISAESTQRVDQHKQDRQSGTTFSISLPVA